MQLEQALTCKPDIVLLDNMNLDQLRAAVKRRFEIAPAVQLEASGGVNLDTVRDIAATGVDRISVGDFDCTRPQPSISVSIISRETGMDNLVEEWSYPAGRIGKQVQIFDCVDSTNTRAMELSVDPEYHGAVIVATTTNLRARAIWPVLGMPARNSGILMSVLLFPPASLRQPALMTALAAVAVAETILEITGIHAGIKWPNDLLMRGKKVCGILIEQGRGVVIGIGLNLNRTEEDFENLNYRHATSLRIQSGQ